jgi:hypothetical protein
MSQPQTHTTTIALSESVPSKVAVGADVVVRARVSCSAACDLRGLPVKVEGLDGLVASGALMTFHAGVNESEAITFKAPVQVGEHSWSVVIEPHDTGDIRHAGCSLPIIIKTIAHGTSLAVWDIPSPVVTGSRFQITVGAKSAANFALKNAEVEVRDERGAVVARERLAEDPWPGTNALYWTSAELTAPDHEGLGAWSVRFAAADLTLPHDGSTAEIRIAIVRPPEHRLIVKVVDKDSKAPIDDVQIRLGAYRGTTDPAGLAEIMLPKGEHELHIWKAGYEAPSRPVDINDDMALEIEASIMPEDDPYATTWTA